MLRQLTDLQPTDPLVHEGVHALRSVLHRIRQVLVIQLLSDERLHLALSRRSLADPENVGIDLADHRRDPIRDALRILRLASEPRRLRIRPLQKCRLVRREQIDHPLDVERRDLDLVRHGPLLRSLLRRRHDSGCVAGCASVGLALERVRPARMRHPSSPVSARSFPSYAKTELTSSSFGPRWPTARRASLTPTNAPSAMGEPTNEFSDNPTLTTNHTSALSIQWPSLRSRQ